jgi:putative transposase
LISKAPIIPKPSFCTRFFYVRYAVSYRDLEEIMLERGVSVDHATLNRWVVRFAPLIAAKAQARKHPMAKSWRMDET